MLEVGLYVIMSWTRCFSSGTTKNLTLVITSLRLDRVIATGLGIGRRQSEYNLLSGLIKLNGQTVTKKSKEVKAGDVIDQISPESVSVQDYTVSRVELLEIDEKSTKKGNFKVNLLRTKNLVITKSEYFKYFQDRN